MRSKLAEQLRKDTDEMVRQMSVDERLDFALSLGDTVIETFARSRGITYDEALRLLQKEKRHGRRYSRCIEELDVEDKAVR
jgi:hypothetical protein